MGNPHSLAATTGRGLDHHGIADAFSHAGGFVDILNRIRRAGNRGYPGLLSDIF